MEATIKMEIDAKEYFNLLDEINYLKSLIYDLVYEKQQIIEENDELKEINEKLMKRKNHYKRIVNELRGEQNSEEDP